MTDPLPKARLRPVIRVFVSSTFNDMRHERNALQKDVYPKLEQLCLRNGFQFQAIDLRWGVSSEAGLDHRTMRICFDELRRAQRISPRPNFLILLGNRYGWRPLPEEISEKEFVELKKGITTDNTDDTDEENIREIRAIRGENPDPIAVLNAWYRRDENAIPPVYLLQSRRQQLPDAKDYTEDALWNEIQAVLWEIINRAKPSEQLRGRFEEAVLADGSPPPIVRFQASATEQEIWHGALRVPDAHEHVLAFFRHIENIGEFAEPAQINDFVDLAPSRQDSTSGDKPRIVPLDRKGSSSFVVPPSGGPGRVNAELPTTGSWVVDETLWDEQQRLKKALRKRLGKKNVFETRSVRLVPARDSQGQPAADVTTDHLAQLCSDVESRLTQIIQGQIEEYWNKTAQASTERVALELKIEQDEHERFGRERGAEDSFVGRQTEMQSILEYVRNDSPWPLVVHGASGCGKTALLARAGRELQKSADAANPSPPATRHSPLLYRFIGVTPHSSDVRSLLGSLCQELRLRHPREGELPADTKALREELHEQFRTATPEQPLILFLDALDQLSDADGGRLLNWIPAGALPGHVKLVVSCLSDRAEGDPAGQPCAELRRRQLPAENFINLDALSEDEARTLLFDRWLPQAGRTVSRDQRERIKQRLASLVCRQPIYLKLLFEEARLWRSYDAAPGLGEGVSALLDQLFDRLCRPANHGQLLVERVLGYLAASRHGLAENEIMEVLFADPDYKAALDQATEQTRHELPASATRIPIAIWSRLCFDLAPYLTERAAVGANVLTFYHRQVAEWVQEHFAKPSDQSWQPHRRLADYFVGCAQGTDAGKKWETLAVRGFAECVFHLVKAGQHDWAASLLSNFPFLLHKLRVGLLEGVFEDYDMVCREAPAEVARRLEIWADFFREKAHILRRGNDEWPAHKILLQLAVEHADDSLLTIAVEKWIAENRCDWLWLRRTPRLPHAQKNSCLAVLEGHTDDVSGALVLDDQRLLSWSKDRTLRLWDSHRGACLATLEGHTDWVNGALRLADGRLLSWSSDKTLRLWDSQSGACLATLEGHTDEVWDSLALTDGRLLSWSPYRESQDFTLRLWDSQSGAYLVKLEGHSNWVGGALEVPNRRLLSWSADNTLRLWDSLSGDCLVVFEGHSNGINGALRLANGRLLSWSEDETLRLWEIHNGTCLVELQGHTRPVHGALELPGGHILSWSWSWDNTLRLWDSNTGICLAKLEGHTDSVMGAMVLADGRILSWSLDKTLRLWSNQSYICLATFEGHAHAVLRAWELADRHLLSLSDDKTLRLWDSQSGSCLAILGGVAQPVTEALVLPGGQVLSWSEQALRLWDSQNPGRLGTLEGHTCWVNGVLALPDGRLVSWSMDGTLRLWDSQSGACVASFEGHEGGVGGALLLEDGRLLTWCARKDVASPSEEGVLRLWDCHSGDCLGKLEGHMGQVYGVLELAGGRLLSWSHHDKTLRLWNSHSGACLASLWAEHPVVGALELPNGRLLSWSQWSDDRTLRLWDGKSGCHLVTLEGHTDWVNGALALADGRLLSWSEDKTLRLWDGQSGPGCLARGLWWALHKLVEFVYRKQIASWAIIEGHKGESVVETTLSDRRLPAAKAFWQPLYRALERVYKKRITCLATLKGHDGGVTGAVALPNGQMLSWSLDGSLRLWDTKSGRCLEVIWESDLALLHPEWLLAREAATNPASVVGEFCMVSSSHSTQLHHRVFPIVIGWEGDAEPYARCLLPDGTAVATQDNGQVCILKLHQGNRRISLAEAEALLASERKKAE